MISPYKHMDLDLSPIWISKLCIEYIKSSGGVDMGELANYIRTEAGAEAEPNFLPALNILYLLGIIDYSPKYDTITLSRKAIKS